MRPKDIKRPSSIPYTRRRFLKGIGAFSIVTAMPWLLGCQEPTRAPIHGPLGRQSQMTQEVLQILFPTDNFGPSSHQVQTYQYLSWILNDPLYDADIKNNIKSGIEHLASFCKKTFGQAFEGLSQRQKEDLIAQANTHTWGERLLSRLVSVILDSLLIAPIYDSNPEEIGWKWLQHIPGLPQATSQNQYPKLLERKKEFVIISKLSDLT